MVRSILLGAMVFTLAALTGAVLASAAAPARPAGEVPDPAAAGSVHQSHPDPTFARSMVYSGTAALTLSVTGIVMVGRRRRLW